MKSSLEVVPRSRDIHESIGVPFRVSVCPFCADLPSSGDAVRRCSVCGFFSGRSCAFCEGRVGVERFGSVKTVVPLSFYVGFICDMSFSAYRYFVQSLRSVPPNGLFLAGVLDKGRVFLLAVKDRNAVFVELGDVFGDLGAMTNTTDDVDTIIDAVSRMMFDGSEGDEHIVLPNFVPADSFAHFIVFSERQITISCESLAVDLVSPPNSLKKGSNALLSASALAQRTEKSFFAFNVAISAMVSDNISVAEPALKLSSVRLNEECCFNVDIVGALGETIYIQFYVVYYVSGGQNSVILHHDVISGLFRTSDDYFEIMEGINPQMVPRNVVTHSFLSKLRKSYVEIACKNIPGDIKDETFTLIPHLRVFDEIISNSDNLISVWKDQNTLIDEGYFSLEYIEQIYGNHPIIVIDSKTKIQIKTNEEINAESKIADFVHEKVSSRFPIPKVVLTKAEKNDTH